MLAGTYVSSCSVLPPSPSPAPPSFLPSRSSSSSLSPSFLPPLHSPSPSPLPPSPALPSGVIDVAAEWMADLKEGWCPAAGYYNREACCWVSNETIIDIESEHCQLWKSWSEYSSIPSGTLGYSFDYFIYVLFAVIFAGLAGLFVTTLAPYAAGSGIPEVRTLIVKFGPLCMT